MENKGNMVKSIIKGGLSLIGGFGIGVMAKTAGVMLTPETAGRLTKFACKVGAMMVAGAVSNIASNEMNKAIDSFSFSINGPISDDVEEVEAEVVE